MWEQSRLEDTELFLLGINHETAPVALRERAAFTAAEVPAMLERLISRTMVTEGAILSTCNRCEIYIVTPQPASARQLLQQFFSDTRPALSDDDFQHFYFYQGEAVMRHLFKVAAGLNSMVIGEPQIVSQVKDAFKQAFDAGTTGIYLNRLFHTAFQATKQVRSETAIAEGAISVSYAAVKLAQKIFKDLSRQQVLLIGSGETGQLVARHLQKAGVTGMWNTNRTFEKAQVLAEELGGTAYPYDQITQLLPEADLVVGATGSPDYVLTQAMVKDVLRRRGDSPLFLIDIAVPRDFDPAINRLNNVFLSDIDALKEIVRYNLEKRQDAVGAANKIIEKNIRELLQWRATLQFKPTIISLRSKLESIRKHELKKYRHKSSEAEMEAIERVTRSMMNKILALPMLKIQDCSCDNGDSRLLINAIQDIFDLHAEEAESYHEQE